MNGDRQVTEGTAGVGAAEELAVDFDGRQWAHPATGPRLDSSRGENTTRAAADGSGRDPNALSDRLQGGAVVLLGLVGKAEETEKDKGADDG